MLESAEQKRQNELGRSHGQSLYKIQGNEYSSQKLKELLHLKTEELFNSTTNAKISLKDTELVKEKAFLYLKSCETVGIFPTNSGLSRALGYTERSLRNWRNGCPEHPTSEFLEAFSDLCNEVLNQQAISGNANPVISIFLNKAFFDRIEKTEVSIKPAEPEKEDVSIEDIKTRYCIEPDIDENEEET